MRTILLLGLGLMLSAIWLPAQEGDPGVDRWSGPDNVSTVQGCLRSSGGHNTVADSNGNVHQLMGDTAKLSHYVGHDVEISGKPSVKTINTTVAKAASTAIEEPALIVKTAKIVSATCNSPTP